MQLHRSKHKNFHQELKDYLSEKMHDGGVSVLDAAQRTIKASAFSEERKEECDLACARWLLKSARPITLPQRDTPFRNFINILTSRAWNPPSDHNVPDNILLLSANGQLRFRSWYESMVLDGVKPSIAGDI
eukprot:2125110-Pleurochrysis_carterae.AAC.2